MKKYMWLHGIVMFIMAAVCIWSHGAGFLGVFWKTFEVFVAYMFVLLFMTAGKVFLKFLDIRIFWWIALFLNVVGIWFCIIYYRDVELGYYDLPLGEEWLEAGWGVIKVILFLIDVLAIYLLTKKHWDAHKTWRVGIYASVLILLLICEIAIAPMYSGRVMFAYFEINIVPVLASVCALRVKHSIPMKNRGRKTL